MKKVIKLIKEIKKKHPDIDKVVIGYSGGGDSFDGYGDFHAFSKGKALKHGKVSEDDFTEIFDEIINIGNFNFNSDGEYEGCQGTITVDLRLEVAYWTQSQNVRETVEMDMQYCGTTYEKKIKLSGKEEDNLTKMLSSSDPEAVNMAIEMAKNAGMNYADILAYIGDN